MEGLAPCAEATTPELEAPSTSLAVCSSPGSGAGSGGGGAPGAEAAELEPPPTALAVCPSPQGSGAGAGGGAAAGEDPALRARYARECQRSTALSNELAVARRDLSSCRELVAAQEAALKHATRQRDTFEALSRRLQEWQRASQAESATQLREESKRREVVHSSAQDLLGKFEAAVKHTAALEAERQALLERDALTQQRVASLEKALTAEHALRDMQDRVIEATRAEGEAVKAHAEDTSKRLAAAMAELTATAASAATYRSELESMGPRLTALGEDFNKSLAMQKEEFSKSIALHRAEAEKAAAVAQATIAELLTRLTASEKGQISALKGHTGALKDAEAARKQCAQMVALCRAQQEQVKALRQASGSGSSAAPAAEAQALAEAAQGVEAASARSAAAPAAEAAAAGGGID